MQFQAEQERLEEIFHAEMFALLKSLAGELAAAEAEAIKTGDSRLQEIQKKRQEIEMLIAAAPEGLDKPAEQ
jgi:hypothetical protein